MKWISHQICSFAIAYAISKDLPLSITTASFSLAPDMVEKSPFFSKHRGKSHNPFMWGLFFVFFALFFQILERKFNIKIQESVIPFFSVKEIGLGFILGVYTHLFCDSLSKSGIPLFRNRKIAFNLYKTWTFSEFLVVLGILFLSSLFCINQLKGFFYGIKRFI